MWTQRYLYDLDHVEILKTRHAHMQCKFGLGGDTQVRQINFSSEKEGTHDPVICPSLLSTATHYSTALE